MQHDLLVRGVTRIIQVNQATSITEHAKVIKDCPVPKPTTVESLIWDQMTTWAEEAIERRKETPLTDREQRMQAEVELPTLLASITRLMKVINNYNAPNDAQKKMVTQIDFMGIKMIDIVNAVHQEAPTISRSSVARVLDYLVTKYGQSAMKLRGGNHRPQPYQRRHFVAQDEVNRRRAHVGAHLGGDAFKARPPRNHLAHHSPPSTHLYAVRGALSHRAPFTDFESCDIYSYKGILIHLTDSHSLWGAYVRKVIISRPYISSSCCHEKYTFHLVEVITIPQVLLEAFQYSSHPVLLLSAASPFRLVRRVSLLGNAAVDGHKRTINQS